METITINTAKYPSNFTVCRKVETTVTSTLNYTLSDADMKKIVSEISEKLEDLDNDQKETFELSVNRLTIFVDVVTRGWDFRSIELVCVDVMDPENNAYDVYAQTIFNLLQSEITQLNNEMESLFINY